jgi:hypothetical protein
VSGQFLDRLDVLVALDDARGAEMAKDEEVDVTVRTSSPAGIPSTNGSCRSAKAGRIGWATVLLCFESDAWTTTVGFGSPGANDSGAVDRNSFRCRSTAAGREVSRRRQGESPGA